MKGLTTSSLILVLTTLTCVYNKATHAQTDSQQQPPCNSCCQGPVGSQGTPGIPGIPGTNGMSGNVGQKGDRGESVKGGAGPRGEKGDIGNPGLKGDSGTTGLRGPSGKVGPAGVAGPDGSPGTTGVKGQKGEMGQSRLSAFSVARGSGFTPSSAGVALPFDVIHTNIGDDFDGALGRFTCEIPGVYLFTYHIMSDPGTVHVQLMKNDNIPINSAYRQNENRYDITSNAAVLQLAVGDTVWLKCRNQNVIYSNGDLYTSFSGAILHEV